MPGQRLDKWLWCARLVRTRTSAARLVEAGKVRVNGARTIKPSHTLRPGDVVTATAGRLWVVRVEGEADRRGPVSEARTLYYDLTPPAPPKAPQARIEVHAGPRPTKRARRRYDAIGADKD
jgi:ribosome-associated heat shock protein Hsp15